MNDNKRDEDTRLLSVRLPEQLMNNLDAVLTSRGITATDLVRIAVKAVLRQTKYYDLQDPLQFGRYYGETLETVARANPSYVDWCLRNIEGFCVSEAALDLLRSLNSRQRVATSSLGDDLDPGPPVSLWDDNDDIPF